MGNAGAWWRRVAVPVAVHVERVDRQSLAVAGRRVGLLLAGSLLAWLGAADRRVSTTPAS